VDDERTGGRSAFDGIDAGYSLGIEGIRAKAVNSLRGEGDKAAVAEELSGAVDFAESDGWGHRRF
jgi:hypothetical protein